MKNLALISSEIQVTKNLSLRKISKVDIPEFLKIVQEDEKLLRKTIPWVDFRNSEEKMDKYLDWIETQIDGNRGICFGIYLNGVFVGEQKIHRIDWANSTAEVGYWMSSRVQGQGIATMTLNSILHLLFIDLELNRVFLSCSKENPKSIAVPKRLGFILEGVLREDHREADRFTDTLIFGMLRREFELGN